MAYASTLLRDPWATYREIDAVGRTSQAASGPKLVQLLYTELLAALRAAASAAEQGHQRIKSERVTRATAILFALESGLDYDQGGELSKTLARIYAGARRSIVNASIGNDPAPFRNAADSLSEIASAWSTAIAA